MKNLIVKASSPWRALLPLLQKIRRGYAKYFDRVGDRLIINGGKIRFLDVELNFPENVGLTYSTPLFWSGPDAYEAPTTRAIALLAGHSRSFLDIGSNIGIYSVYAGVKFPQVKTFAFEPVPAIWKKNCAFHRANGLSEQNVLNLALSDRDGVQKIFIPFFQTGVEEEQTATLSAQSWQAHHERVEAVDIQCLTLDSFAQKQPPPGPVALKIDVENFEAAVLRGGRNFITARRPWMVCEILPREEFDESTKSLRNNNQPTLSLIAELGYVPFAITADGFFRMSAADFSRPRELKDFLLAPTEKISADLFYFRLSTLAEMLPAKQGQP